MMTNTCPICSAQNEEILLQTPNLRVIAVHNEANAPAFCRVIWQNHVAEMTDLSATQCHEIMDMVYRVEAAMREVLQPSKINLASLGNVVPHLHWHVIARFADDACFPAPIWANPVRKHGFSKHRVGNLLPTRFNATLLFRLPESSF
ncbi:HIT family protein [Wielerella bovis]|uniref:HIT family protein n=1 Tax=Wielerella bovis TaxID=2917790 RepID=UPI002018958C|nr:HIT domain-containing protein [Wielerella bovis]ULJ59874.1 HIT domain-containing protein [Wielerella bovis]